MSLAESLMHSMTHPQEKRYRCEKISCDFKTDRLDELEKHKLQHIVRCVRSMEQP